MHLHYFYNNVCDYLIWVKFGILHLKPCFKIVSDEIDLKTGL